MSKVALNNITGGYAAVDLLNENFDAIEAAFDNTLSRDGSTPNTWLANQDANHKRLLNVADPVDGKDAANKDFVINAQVDAIQIAFDRAAYHVDRFTGNGSDTTFTLSVAPGIESNAQVYINGAYQNKNTFSVSGTTLTFTEVPPFGSSIEVFVVEPLQVATADAANVQYSPGSGGVQTTVEAKLRETVSVKDFGAVGDGVTDDTQAIQDAIDYWLNGDVPCTLTFPAGKYVITDVLVCSPQQTILQQKTLFGYGATIINQSATKALQFITTVNKKYWANAVIEGLTISGGVDCFSFEAGGPTNSDWMYQFTLKNLNAINFSGIGFYGYDGFFESAFYSCVAWGAGSNTTGYGFKFQNGPSSVISSIDIYNANTRYCRNGIRTINPVQDVDIYGGTFLLAYEEGIRLELALGTMISGVHVEQNWQSGSGTIRPGIRYTGSASLVGITAQSGNAAKQNYGAQLYSFGPSFLSSCHAGGAGHTAFGYYAGGATSTDGIYSMGTTYTAVAGAQIFDPRTSSGTYIPTLTGVTNITSASAVACQYARNGDVITVSGYVSVVSTAGAGAATELRISLPVASNFASGNQCAGTANYYNPTASLSTFGIIRADATNDTALLQFNSNVAGGGGMPIYFTFTYLVI